MESTEKIVVSLTSWTPRLCNLPIVLSSIFEQTLSPDIVVLNLSEGEVLPRDIEVFLLNHQVTINFVPNTKVYKKLIPTLIKYPNDCVIVIDDDWIYPAQMIQEFIEMHAKYPDNPISGKKEICGGIPMHCGCASLTKASFFDDLSLIDEQIMNKCKSDDMVYSYFASKSGHPYVWTNREYYLNMTPYNSNNAYTEDPFSFQNEDVETLNYLTRRFGKISSLIDSYVHDPIVSSILQSIVDRSISNSFVEGERSIRSTYSYRLGHNILYPIAKIREIINKK